jgi:hypothetical protein
MTLIKQSFNLSLSLLLSKSIFGDNNDDDDER